MPEPERSCGCIRHEQAGLDSLTQSPLGDFGVVGSDRG